MREDDRLNDEIARQHARERGPRVFKMLRRVDVSGVSGTGHVADAVEFEDGTFVLRWRIDRKKSTAIYATMADAVEVHGHDGRTTFEEV